MKHFRLYLMVLLIPFQQIRGATYNILDFGARGDGLTLNTKAIQQAIDKCRQDGGGTVIVPAGIFLSGTLYLCSHFELQLQAGAMLKGSPRLEDYARAASVHLGLLYAMNLVDITLSGPGNIDGNGDVFFRLDTAKKIDGPGTRFTRQREHFREVKEGIGDGPVVPLDRPYQLIIFSGCRNVTVRDLLISNGSFWTLHFADCDAVHVSGIRLFNNMMVPNADGIDVTSCTNVTITGCDIRAGDDAIAITGYDHHFEIPGFQHLRHPSENIQVSNCNLQSYSSGIRIGFLDQNSVRNIHVSNVNITNSTRGIGLFLRDEGSLENIFFSNIFIETTLRTGDWWGNGEPIHISAVRGKPDGKLGKISHVRFDHIICRGENGILLFGSAESEPEDIAFRDISFELVDSKLNELAGGNVDLRGCLADSLKLFSRDIPGFLAEHVSGLLIDHFTLTWTGTRMPFFTHGIEISHFRHVRIHSFQGAATPLARGAYSIFAHEGKDLVTDDKQGLGLRHVQ